MIEINKDGVFQDGIKIADDVEDAAWNQGYLEMAGLRQKDIDTRTCQVCHKSYQVRRAVRFVPRAGLLAEYIEAPDPGCPYCTPEEPTCSK